MADYDAIIVGAGHNGLAAAAVLAKQRLKVLVLEKNKYVGGMASTVEHLKGYKHDVAASVLFPLSDEVVEDLELKTHGLDVIETPVMSCSFGVPAENPVRVVVLHRSNVGLGDRAFEGPRLDNLDKPPEVGARRIEQGRVPLDRFGPLSLGIRGPELAGLGNQDPALGPGLANFGVSRELCHFTPSAGRDHTITAPM